MAGKWELYSNAGFFKKVFYWIKNHAILSITVVISVLVMILLILGMIYSWDWIGIVEYKYSDIGNVETVTGKKTFWEFMELLIVPIVLALGGYWLSQNEANRELATTRREKFIAYLDQMSNLIDKGLSEADKDSSLSIVARARTLTILSTVEARDKREIVIFLFISRLITADYSRRGVLDLSDADFKEVNLSHLFDGSKSEYIDISGANLERSDLRRNFFYGARLSMANLSGANLAGPRGTFAESIFHETNLSKANFRNAFIRRTFMMSANLTKSDLEEADMEGAYLINAKLNGAVLRNANAMALDARGANFNKADLSGANLHLGRFETLLASGNRAIHPGSGVGFDPNSFLLNKNFGEDVNTDFTEAILKNTNLRGANFTNAILKSADLRGADLSTITLGSPSDPMIYQSRLVSANLTGARLEDVDLTGADLTGAKVEDAQLQKAKSLKGTTMPNGELHS